MKTDLNTIVAGKQARLKALLSEAWALEAELNALHRQMRDADIIPSDPVPAYDPPVQPARPTQARASGTTQRIQAALLRGPLALKNQKYNTTLLVERCEDIPGADVKAVRTVLRELVRAGFIRCDRHKYWRAA